ncbi:hypothetical protein EON65_36625 [archaeon]|nr:MAG: hypothetical protein EON65_36625 [archaeon]
MPTMNALPVEDHIRGVVKDLLRTRGIAKRGLVPDTNNTLRIPLKVLKSRLSIQASSHYDAIMQEERKQKMTHRYISMSARNFLGGGKTTIINNKDVPLAVGEPYLDAWANPMLVKGVPTSQHQLTESSRLQKPLFAAPPEKAFVSRVGGNRSTALANDLFDVIADAQETGGAIQRHLGTNTARFGLPASADHRELPTLVTQQFNTDAPPSPIRTSTTLRTTKARLVFGKWNFLYINKPY